MRESMPETQGKYVDRGPVLDNSREKCGPVKRKQPFGKVWLVYHEAVCTEEALESIVRQGRRHPREIPEDLTDLALLNDINSREELALMEAWAKGGFVA